jgi:DNA topoisomerase-3
MSIGNPSPPFTVGRVQTAVLSAVASRNGEVKSFIPVPYKQLQAEIFSGAKPPEGIHAGSIKALLENPKTGKSSFFAEDEKYLLAALNGCKNKPISSVDVASQEKRKKPEKLLNITGLQKIAFKRFGYKPEETLNIAQSLYETHKCLSYPRTPSRVMGDNNVDLFREKFELLKSKDEPPYNFYPVFCDEALINAGNKNIFDSSKLEDHHALIPLAALPEGANEKEKNVYTIVLESFFKVCMNDYIYNQKFLRFHIGEYIFTSTVRDIVQPGWIEVFYSESDDNNKKAYFDPFDENNCAVMGLHMLEKKTEPKKEYAIDTLLAFMENPKEDESSKLACLGTPATRGEIINKLFANEYLKEEGKKLYASSRAHFLLGALRQNECLSKIASVSQTTEWENRLAEDPVAFEKEIAEYVKNCVKADLPSAPFQKEPIGTCPLCKKPVFETKLSYGCSGYKDNPKCSFAIWKSISGAAVSPNDASLLLIGQKTKFKKCKSKDGKAFEVAFFLKGGKVDFVFKK